ncbi:hypothetical protein [Methanospirillum lacunae]|uniref:hypothetical protein n=1 Tax=Methanospirillum lacunae TaxID=668570 RepID=UPI0038FC2431
MESEDVAKEIVRYLKKEGIPARITTEPRMTVALILAGRHEDLKAFLTACQEKHQEHGTGGEDTDRYPKEFDSSVWNNTLEDLHIEQHAVSQILDEHKPGDIIGSHIFQSVFLKTKSENDCTPEEFARELATVRTLISNRLCEITQQGFVLISVPDPGSVTLYIPFDYPFPPEKEVCDRYHITCIRHFRGEMDHVVLIGPEILLLEDIEAFVMFLSENGVTPRSLISITERCMSRLRITQELIDQLFDAGESSLEDLRLHFVDEIATQDGQGYVQDRFGLSPEYVDSLVKDMRKLGLIKGKDSRIRPGNPFKIKPSSRQNEPVA